MASAATLFISASDAIKVLRNRNPAVLNVPIYTDPTMTNTLQRRFTSPQGIQKEVSCKPTLTENSLTDGFSGITGI